MSETKEYQLLKKKIEQIDPECDISAYKDLDQLKAFYKFTKESQLTLILEILSISPLLVGLDITREKLEKIPINILDDIKKLISNLSKLKLSL